MQKGYQIKCDSKISMRDCLENCPVYTKFKEVAGLEMRDTDDEEGDPFSVYHYGNDTTVIGNLLVPIWLRKGMCNLSVEAVGPKNEEVFEKVEEAIKDNIVKIIY